MFDIIGAMVAGATYSIIGYTRKLRQDKTQEGVDFSLKELVYSIVLGSIAGLVATYYSTDITTANLLIASFAGTVFLNEAFKRLWAWVTKDTVTA